MLWQVHYYYSPLYLEAMLGSDREYLIGIIMSLDNLFAIFMIPLFGLLSDKTKSKHGRRMPYIVAGSVLALILFPLMALMAILNSLVWFIVLMILMIVAMTVYRSPAVALMPDITPKPLRPKANAIVNFVGYIGAILAGGLTMLFVFDTGNMTMSIIPFIITGVFMMFAVTMLLVRFRENKIVEEMREQLILGEKMAETLDTVVEDKPLSARDRANLFIIMGAVFLAFFAFAALSKFGSLYGTEVLGTNAWGMTVAVLAIASLITFLPSVKLTKKIGRKNSIIVGLTIIIATLIGGHFIATYIGFGVPLVAMFAISGVGWAIVNVNTYPMVVEMASRKNVGKYTGIYYVASQVAQALTTILVGFVFTWLGREVYFLYAIVFMTLALILCLFFRTNKNNQLPKTTA